MTAGVLPCTEATMRTDVGMVPAETTVVTVPLAPVVAESGARATPPTGVAEKEKSTATPASVCPLASRTSNVRLEDSWRPTPPVPLSAILVVSAETNLTDAAALVDVPEAVAVTHGSGCSMVPQLAGSPPPPPPHPAKAADKMTAQVAAVVRMRILREFKFRRCAEDSNDWRSSIAHSPHGARSE